MNIVLVDMEGDELLDQDVAAPNRDGSFPSVILHDNRVFRFDERYPRNRVSAGRPAAAFIEVTAWRPFE